MKIRCPRIVEHCLQLLLRRFHRVRVEFLGLCRTQRRLAQQRARRQVLARRRPRRRGILSDRLKGRCGRIEIPGVKLGRPNLVVAICPQQRIGRLENRRNHGGFPIAIREHLVLRREPVFHRCARGPVLLHARGQGRLCGLERIPWAIQKIFVPLITRDLRISLDRIDVPRALYLLARLRPRFRGRTLAPVHRTCRPHVAVPYDDRIALLLAVELKSAQITIGHNQVGAPQRGQHNPKLPRGELRLRGLRHSSRDENRLVEVRSTAVDRARHRKNERDCADDHEVARPPERPEFRRDFILRG